ncbi:hypothetical protein CANARDRAFT_6052 [[Candida] arabinofermentans NRRL YB-2248]|uniref:Checkpoint protein n=1 Tax=[Candida] arabinofermentans NRRL YB-2248 TaxID=983967 RepID=A0A1E4T729_9ASCO|nr:hypothetical protein CANARDRAFT_6052 [[Candida] arabinofermentans NRRL YB-2248]
MKLKVTIDIPTELRKCLGFLLNVRKLCVFRFTGEQLIIISSAVNEPQVWCKIDKTLFQIYEVDSTRDNVIPFEINIEPLFQVLRNFEKSMATSNLSMRLQRRPNIGDSVSESKNKAAASLALFYTEQISITSQVSHSFNVPVRLLKMESDERIQEPSINLMKLAMKLPSRILPLFKRIERYKTSDTITLTGNKLGQLRFTIEEDQRKMEIQWKEKLEVSPDSIENQDESEMDEDPNLTHADRMPELSRPINLRVKLKYWNIGTKLIELCDAMSLIVHDAGGILHCYIDVEQKCDIAYYINGYQNLEL